MPTEFKLPELGENITSGTIARVLVAVGETVAEGQPLIEIETDKAVAEIPSTVAGTVTEIRVSEGQKVQVGAVLMVFDAAEAAAVRKTASPTAAKTPPKLAVLERADGAAAPKTPSPVRAPERAAAARGAVVASPTVRRLARELGVDVNAVPTSDPTGRVTAEDVRRFAESASSSMGILPTESNHGRDARATGQAGTTPPKRALTEGKWGPESREAMTTIRSKTAERMSANWVGIPHVTHHDKADITGFDALRKKCGPAFEAAGAKLTVTALLVKVVVEALKRFPKFNASIDVERGELVFKHYYHIGIAADTEHGLLVPVLRDADKKTIRQISVEMAQLAAKARSRKLALDEMQGGTFTISNLGGIGGTGFTPIINAPEVALLGVSRAAIEPVFLNGQFAPRAMLPLSLSYDHRIIDGAEAARFVRWTAEALEQPWGLLLEE
ncbi:MAG TPA: 2-oxo acid dehydrogenase subunit E2 [Candidatus Hydrogenedentes bacterium]|nr:2-oxo acid dehydrogenase subunit E2 [Candidatus Hydrogenedentota bacterium]HNT87006.1 2-oxo acid dehydrogenase subunit E2 [Candidatus Hydrogenedentota bacterium]